MRMNLSQRFIFFSKKIRDGDCFASLMIPLFAKNSRLGYFFNANNPQGGSYDTESVKTIAENFRYVRGYLRPKK